MSMSQLDLELERQFQILRSQVGDKPGIGMLRNEARGTWSDLRNMKNNVDKKMKYVIERVA